MFRKARWAVVVLLCVLPTLIALAYIHAYGVDVVFWDELYFVLLFEKYHEGTLTFHDFYSQHNEHRLVFPRLIILFLGLVTDFDTVVEMYVGWGFLCSSALLIYLFCARQFADRYSACIAFIPVAWVMFNLRQQENLLWGMQLLFFMAVTLFLLTMQCLAKARRLDGWLLAAGAAGVVGTFSFSSLLLVWPIGLVMILMNRQSRGAGGWRAIVPALSFWGILGAVVSLLYFVGYERPGIHPSLLVGFKHPVEFIRYLSLYLASPLGRGLSVGPVLGVILLVLYLASIVVAYRRWRRGTPLPVLPIAMIVFALGSAVTTTVARVGFGSSQALVSRYVTFSCLGLIGLYLTALSLKPGFRLRTGKHDVVVVLLGLVLLFVIYPMYDRTKGVEMYRHRSRMAYYLSSTPFQSDETLKAMLDTPVRVRESSELLRRYHLNVYAKEPWDFAALQRSTDASWSHGVDHVNGKSPGNPPRAIQIPEKAHSVTIAGWAHGPAENRPVRAVFVELDGCLEIPGLCGLVGPRVGEHLETGHCNCGFEIRFAKTLMKKGRHTLRLKMVSADGTSYYEAGDPLTVEVL